LNARRLLAKAQAFTGPPEEPGLLHAALKALIDGESARPLARLAGIASPAPPTWGAGDAMPLKSLGCGFIGRRYGRQTRTRLPGCFGQ